MFSILCNLATKEQARDQNFNLGYATRIEMEAQVLKPTACDSGHDGAGDLASISIEIMKADVGFGEDRLAALPGFEIAASDIGQAAAKGCIGVKGGVSRRRRRIIADPEVEVRVAERLPKRSVKRQAQR